MSRDAAIPIVAPHPRNHAAGEPRSFGEYLRTVRRQRGLSQSGLAHATGLHHSHISLIERGRRDPQLETLVVLARALGITAGQLADWRDSAVVPAVRCANAE